MSECIRQAVAADLEIVASMMSAFYEESDFTLDRDRSRSALELLLSDADLGRVWIILDRAEPAGYVAVGFGFSLEYYGRDAFVDELFIRPGSRGAGLGTRVLAAVESECRAEGVNALHLEVAPGNSAGLALYERRGFSGNGRHLLSKRIR